MICEEDLLRLAATWRARGGAGGATECAYELEALIPPTTPLRFVVPGKPLGQNGAYIRRSMKDGGTGMRKSDEAVAYQQLVACMGGFAKRGTAPFIGPVELHLAEFFANERPDIDGPVKFIMDALQAPKGKRRIGASVYGNDRQVRRLVVEYHIDPVRPRVEVGVAPLPADFSHAKGSVVTAREARLSPNVRRFG